MAALQTLRNRAGVLIAVLVALALLAFILTDLLGSGNSIFQDNETIGKVDGKKLNYKDYQALIEENETFAKLNGQNLTDQMQNQMREQVWRTMVNDNIMAEVYENAGIDVTAQEVLDMTTGSHIAPELRQIFTNPNTGVYDRQFAMNFLQNKNQDPQAYFFWNYIEKSLVRDRKSSKYLNLLTSSLYQTKSEKEDALKLRSNSKTAQFVGVRYTLIADSLVEVSNNEIKAEYNKYKELYKTDALRSIEYVSFPVRPTAEDREDVRKAVASMIEDFKADENPMQYAMNNAENPLNTFFVSEDKIAMAGLKDFAKTGNVGEVYGPYADGNEFKITRLVDRQARPDSVRASHILLRSNAQIADSILSVAKKSGSDFAELAKKFSEDNGSAVNGGDLGWFQEGVMVPEFNNACFSAHAGDIVKVASQFGIHIIKVEAVKGSTQKYLLATIDKEVVFGQRTHQAVYSEAQTFASQIKNLESFNAQVDSMNMIRRYGNNIRSNAQSVNNLQHARELVKWAFGAKEGEVSPLFEVGNGDEFVVAVLTKSQDKGYTSVDELAPMLKRDILMKKKAQKVASETAGMTLAQIAEKYGVSVDTVSQVKYASNSIAGVGSEPALVGAILKAEQGVQSPVVTGNNAAYSFIVTSSNEEPATEQEVEQKQAQDAQSFMYYASNQLVDVEVDDNRIKFY